MTDDEPMTYLGDLEFPATKLDVIATAESNGAPQDTLECLQAVRGEQFDSEQTLRDSLGSS